MFLSSLKAWTSFSTVILILRGPTQQLSLRACGLSHTKDPRRILLFTALSCVAKRLMLEWSPYTSERKSFHCRLNNPGDLWGDWNKVIPSQNFSSLVVPTQKPLKETSKWFFLRIFRSEQRPEPSKEEQRFFFYVYSLRFVTIISYIKYQDLLAGEYPSFLQQQQHKQSQRPLHAL